MSKRRVLGLAIPPVLFCLVDCVVTLEGQPPEYWAGNYGQAQELSPTFAQLLYIHPLAFLAGTVAIIAIYVGLILLLPDVMGTILSIALTLGHTFAASTWLDAYSSRFPYQLVNGFYVLSAVVMGVCIHWAYQSGSPEVMDDQAVGSGGNLTWRWFLAGILIAAISYLYLIPH